MSIDDQFDFFVSYARADNTNGWITNFIAELLAEHERVFPRRESKPFFDQHAIINGADWQLYIAHGVAHSRLFLAFISPNYFASEWCRKEWLAWIDAEIAQHILTQGVRPVYIVEVPGLTGKGALSEQDVAQKVAELCGLPPPHEAFVAASSAVVKQLRRRDFSQTQVQSFFTEGIIALRHAELRAVLEGLAKDLDHNADLLRRADASLSTVPVYNAKFTGRLDELLRLREQLIKDDRTGIISGVHGLGGIGKTELALTYAHAFASAYPGGRFIIGCDNRTSLRDAVLGQGNFLALFRQAISDEERKQPETYFAAVIACLRERLDRLGHVLLVLDNVTDSALMVHQQTGCLTVLGPKLHLLATTRLAPPSGARGNWLTLGALPESDALDLLEKHRPFASAAEHSAAQRIARRLGGFTLAVELVAAWLSAHERSSDYSTLANGLGLEDLEHIAAEGAGEIFRHNYERRLTAVLNPVLGSLNPAERRALEYAALLPPDGVPLPWLKTLVTNDFPELARTGKRTDPWGEVLERLEHLALFSAVECETSEPSVVRMHRLLQEVVSCARPTEQPLLLASILRVASLRIIDIEGSLNGFVDGWELTVLYEVCRLGLSRSGAAVAQLVLAVSHCLERSARFAEARYLAHQIIAPLEREYGPSSVEALSCLNLLGILHLRNAELEVAERLLDKARAVCEASDIQPHPMLAATLNNLGMVYQETNRLEPAETLLRTAICLDLQASRKSDLGLAGRFTNLSIVLHNLNQLPEALGFAKQALAIDAEHYGREHPRVADDLNSVARILHDMGNTAEALKQMEEALVIDRKYLPGGHPQLASHLSNLGGILDDAGESTRAEPLLREALVIDYKRCGKRHPILAVRLNNLAVNLRNQQQYHEALQLHRESLRMDLDCRGPDHPKVALRHTNLAVTLMMSDDFQAAGAHLSSAWQISNSKHDLLGLRIVATRFALALLMAQASQTFLGQLKTLLEGPRLTAQGIDRIWFNAPIWNWLERRLWKHALRGLAEAIFRAASLGVQSAPLLLAEEWRTCAPVPLDRAW